MFRSKFKIVVGLLLIVIVFLGVGISFFLFTTQGVEAVLKTVLSRHAEKGNINYTSLDGNLVQGVTFEDIELKSLNHFPEGTTLRIQKLFVNLTSLGVEGLLIEAENARLRLPDSEPIIIAGTFKDEHLDFNVYSKGLTIESFLSYFLQARRAHVKVTGSINDIDLYIKGEYTSPFITGEFSLDQLSYKGIVLSESHGTVDFNAKDFNDDLKLIGNVVINSGLIKSKRTVVKLEESKILFLGLPRNPSFDLKGNSTIEKTKIQIALKGSFEKPDLQLSSEPSCPREKIMLMLATGKSWKGAEESLDNGILSPNLTKDFIDYFIFAGKGNRFAQKFGLSELSVNFDKKKSGVSAKKALTEKIDVGYGIEQSKETEQQKKVTQKLESEYKLNEKISVGIEREIKQKQLNGLLDEQVNENNDKVLLKYKESF